MVKPVFLMYTEACQLYRQFYEGRKLDSVEDDGLYANTPNGICSYNHCRSISLRASLQHDTIYGTVLISAQDNWLLQETNPLLTR